MATIKPTPPKGGDGKPLVNDLTITKDAVYFTDSFRPVLYRLPLSRNGGIPLDPGAATEVALSGEFINGDPFCCTGNGTASTPNGETLIIGHSTLARLYRLDTASGDVNQIAVDGPLPGSLDGIAMQGDTLYDRVQVVQLDKGYPSGTLVQTITDPENLDGVASGAIFGGSLYVNNARCGASFLVSPQRERAEPAPFSAQPEELTARLSRPADRRRPCSSFRSRPRPRRSTR